MSLASIPYEVSYSHIVKILFCAKVFYKVIHTFTQKRGSFDTTVSYGYAWRVEDQDPNLISKS